MKGALGAGGVGLIASGFGPWNYWCVAAFGLPGSQPGGLGSFSVTASLFVHAAGGGHPAGGGRVPAN